MDWQLTPPGSLDLAEELKRGSVTPWIVEASRPYCDQMFASETELYETISSWTDRKSSELWSGRTWLAVADGDRVGGGMIVSSGAVLPRLRQMDALAYVKASSDKDVERRRNFLELSSAVFPQVDVNHLYLSRIGVLPSFRGKGCAKAMIDKLRLIAAQEGASAITLDVATSNERALELYSHAGFQPGAIQRQEILGLSYVRMSKSLA